MPEGRFLSKSIATSEQVASVSLLADYLFTRMIPHLDCEGRMPGSPRTVRGIVCPLRDDVSVKQVAGALLELHTAGLLVWYVVDGAQYVEFPKFRDHQRGARFDREGASRIPPAPSDPSAADSGSTPGVVPQDAGGLRLSEVKGSEVKSSEGKVSPTAPPRTRAPRPTWVAEGLSWWEPTVGAMKPATFDRTLATIVTLHGWPAVFPDLKQWVAERKAARKPINLTWYASEASARITAAPPPPIVDEHGCLTEYGERITRPDKVPA